MRLTLTMTSLEPDSRRMREAPSRTSTLATSPSETVPVPFPTCVPGTSSCNPEIASMLLRCEGSIRTTTSKRLSAS